MNNQQNQALRDVNVIAPKPNTYPIASGIEQEKDARVMPVDDNPVPNRKPIKYDFRVVVYCGDIITDDLKKVPQYRLGGKLYPEFKTVPGNVLTRCQLTVLKTGMVQASKSTVQKPEEYIQSYTIKNHRYNPNTNQFEDLTVNDPTQIYSEIFPIHEIGKLVYRDQCGVVEVPGLNNKQEVLEAQLFFFPNWNEILKGEAELPDTDKLTAHIKERVAEAKGDATLVAVGRAFLESIAQYKLWATRYTAKQKKVIKDAEKKADVSQFFSEIAERLFDDLNLDRTDTGVEQSNKQIAEGFEGFQEVIRQQGETQRMMAEQQAATNQILIAIAQGQKFPTPIITPENQEEVVATPKAETKTETAQTPETIEDETAQTAQTSENGDADNEPDADVKTCGDSGGLNAAKKPCSNDKNLDENGRCSHHPLD